VNEHRGQFLVITADVYLSGTSLLNALILVVGAVGLFESCREINISS
jgi:hypothetical protein